MKAKDLMIGDWYAFRGHPYKCTASDIASIAECEEKGAPTDISEIPLTPEILEKNGFVRNLFWHYYKRTYGEYIVNVQLGYANKIEYIKIKEGGKDDIIPSEKTLLYLPHISYVHELQHALRLCGIEKEITI